MKRSGNHIFIQSLIENYDTVKFCNNVTVGSGKLIRSRSIYASQRDLLSPEALKRIVYTLPPKDKDNDRVALIYSFEDVGPSDFAYYRGLIENNSEHKRITAGRTLRVTSIAVLRDIRNMIASRVAHGTACQEAVQMWTQIAQSAYKKVIYNKFIGDATYRAELALELGLTRLDVSSHVPQFGRGSSFCPGNTEACPLEDYFARHLAVKVDIDIPEDVLRLSAQLTGI